MPKVLVVVRNPEVLSALRRAAAETQYFEVLAADRAGAVAVATEARVDCAVLDLGPGSRADLDFLSSIKAYDRRMRIVAIVDYASIGGAVEVIKRGAHDYLQRASGDALLRSLTDVEKDAAGVRDVEGSSLQRFEWEHLQRALRNCAGNISAAARELRMHRRTLQRKLQRLQAQGF